MSCLSLLIIKHVVSVDKCAPGRIPTKTYTFATGKEDADKLLYTSVDVTEFDFQSTSNC